MALDRTRALHDLQEAHGLVADVAAMLNVQSSCCDKCGRVTYESREQQQLYEQLAGVAQKIQTLTEKVQAFPLGGDEHGTMDQSRSAAFKR